MFLVGIYNKVGLKMASEVEICNLALQKVGASRISSLTENSKEAKECNFAYALVRDREIRKYKWNFAKARTLLAPDTTTPIFGQDYQFSLPSDCIRPLPTNQDTDWEIEGRKLLSSSAAIIELKYIKQVIDPNLFDDAFIDVLAIALALQINERLTQSNTKKQITKDDYREAIAMARKVNAFSNIAESPPDDSWITARN